MNKQYTALITVLEIFIKSLDSQMFKLKLIKNTFDFDSFLKNKKNQNVNNFQIVKTYKTCCIRAIKIVVKVLVFSFGNKNSRRVIQPIISITKKFLVNCNQSLTKEELDFLEKLFQKIQIKLLNISNIFFDYESLFFIARLRINELTGEILNVNLKKKYKASIDKMIRETELSSEKVQVERFLNAACKFHQKSILVCPVVSSFMLNTLEASFFSEYKERSKKLEPTKLTIFSAKNSTTDTTNNVHLGECLPPTETNFSISLDKKFNPETRTETLFFYQQKKNDFACTDLYKKMETFSELKTFISDSLFTCYTFQNSLTHLAKPIEQKEHGVLYISLYL